MNDEEVIAEFLWAGYTRYSAVRILADIDRAMRDVEAGRVTPIDMDSL